MYLLPDLKYKGGALNERQVFYWSCTFSSQLVFCHRGVRACSIMGQAKLHLSVSPGKKNKTEFKGKGEGSVQVLILLSLFGD